MIEDLTVKRVFLLGDTHGDTQSTQLAVQKAKHTDCDVILQLGDFGFMGAGVDKFLRKTNRALVDAGLHLFWVDGNHENHDRLDMWPLNEWGYRDTLPDNQLPENNGTPCHIHHLPRGFRWTWEGVRFLALGGAFSVDKDSRKEHISWWPQETISAGDVFRCGTDPADVMVTHDVPWEVEDPYGPHRLSKNLWPESNANRMALSSVVNLVKPRLLVHGHTHWRKTTVYDVGDYKIQVEGLSSNPYWKGGGLGEDQYSWFDLQAIKDLKDQSLNENKEPKSTQPPEA